MTIEMIPIDDDRAKPTGYFVATAVPKWVIANAPFKQKLLCGRYVVYSAAIPDDYTNPRWSIDSFQTEGAAQWMVDKLNERAALLIMVQGTKAKEHDEDLMSAWD